MRAKETQTGGQADHESEHEHEHGTAGESESVRISVEAQRNLGLSAAPLKLATYFRKVDVPGVITDRPGVSDRGVVAPLTGIVTKIHVYPGSTVASGEPLFSLRLVSDSLQSSQLELFKSTK
jgi:multidrug efflux pump subunit AcrA (membrane-fusion protein)